MHPLARLRAALEEYLAAGEDTPVAGEVEALLGAVEQAEGGAPEGPEGGMPEMPPMPEEAGGGLMQREIPQPSDGGYEGGDFKDARQGALDFLKSRPGQGPSGEEEVPPEMPRRKRSKAAL